MVTPDSLIDAIRENRLPPALWREAISRLPPPRLLRVAEQLYAKPAHPAEAAALIGHAAYHRRDYRLAVEALEAARAMGRRPREDLLALAHALAAEGRIADAAAVAAALARTLRAGSETAWARTLVALARGDHADALAALRPITQSRFEPPFGVGRDEVDWMVEYLASGLGQKPGKNTPFKSCLSRRWASSRRAADAGLVFGILDYKSCDLRGSGRNVDDWIQTAAALRHIMRFHDASWSYDDPTLKHPAERLEATWQAHERRPAQRARLHIAVIDRDEPWSAAHIHSGSRIWLIVNGWFLHSSFDLTRGLPFPANVHPIFVGFHLAVADHLDDRLVGYLKAHEPIGCRDWATVWWLLNRGVDAFFSGCLTLALAGGAHREARRGRMAVDMPEDSEAAEDTPRATHLAQPDFRIGPAVNHALDLLEHYAAAEQVATSRLHAYLACLAFGTPVALDTKMAGERRFDGLDDLTPGQVATLRGRLTRSLDAILGWILSRASASDVALLWRSINAGLVEEAKARLRAATLPPQAGPPSAGRSGRRKRKTRPAAPPPLVLAFDGVYAPHVPPVVRSCAALAADPVEFIFLVRNIDDLALRRLEAQTAGFDAQVIRADRSEPGKTIPNLRPSPALDRLRLPELLPKHDRIVSLDIDTVFLGDVAELAAQEVSDLGIGARTEPTAHGDILAKLFDLPANRGSTAQAKEFRRFAAANLDLWAPSFECGVLVLSLEALRRHDFTARTTAIIEQFGVPPAVAFNAFAAGRFSPLPKAWNTMPYYEWPEDPKLVHFRGPLKPWTPGRSPRFAECWRKHAREAAAAPAASADKARTTAAG